MSAKAGKTKDFELDIVENIQVISKKAADKFIELGNKYIKKNDCFTVALSGGSTPKELYSILTSEEYKDKIDWEKIFFAFGDERDVSPISEKSNFRLANELLFKPLNVPQKNICRWHTEIIVAEEVAENYNKTLTKFFKLEEGEFPKFDLIFLGMGEDGHTASLFPFSKALAVENKLAVSNYVEIFRKNRLTLTYPVLNNASNIIFMVAGENKAEALTEVLEGEENSEKYPAQSIKPNDGKLLWLVDEQAAQNLNS